MNNIVNEEDIHINNLVLTMVNSIKLESPIHINLILSGGAFNAIYLVGCLYFIREMEHQNKMMIHRISACSASSLVALLYLTNNLELFETKIYNMIVHNFKQNKKYIFSDEDVTAIFTLIETILYEVNGFTEYEILKKVNYKLYVTYFDIKKCKRVIRKKYKSLNDIFETIKKSSYIPFFTMNYILYENRYMDGWQPYIFKSNNNKSNNSILLNNTFEKKNLFIDLLGIDKIKDCIILKNNKKNKDKIIHGVVDTYSFFCGNGKYETSMCSYLGECKITYLIKYYLLYIFSYVLCFFLYLCIFYFQFPSYNIINIAFVKVLFDFVKNAIYYFIEHFCL